MVSKLDKDPILISIWCDQILNEKTFFLKLEIQTMCNQLHDFKGIVEEMKNISSTILKLINSSLSQKVVDFFCYNA